MPDGVQGDDWPDGGPGGGGDVTQQELNDAVALLIPLTQKGAANGVATLGGTGKVPVAQSVVESVDGRTGAVVLSDLYAPAIEPIAAAHISDGTDAHDASAISTVPAGSLAATNVQTSLAELDAEKAAVAEPVAQAHIDDAADAHDASAISVVPFSIIAATTVQAALEELLTEAGGTPGADSITNAMLVNMAEATVKGRAAGAGTGDPTDLTKAQLLTLLGIKTAVYDLPLERWYFPDGSGSGNAAAVPKLVNSGGTQTANTPKVTLSMVTFDDTNDQHMIVRGILPPDYVSGGTMRFAWSADSATSGDAVFKSGIVVATATTDMDAAVFNAADLSAAIAVPGMVGRQVVTDIALTMTGAAAGLPFVAFLGRDRDNASDTVTGTLLQLHTAQLLYERG